MEGARPSPLLTSKTTTKIATWNIRSMYEAAKAAHVAAETKNYMVSLLGLCETRQTQPGQVRLSSRVTILHSGHEEAPTLYESPRCWQRKHNEHSSARRQSAPESSPQSSERKKEHKNLGCAMLRSHKWRWGGEEGVLLQQAPECAGQAKWERSETTNGGIQCIDKCR